MLTSPIELDALGRTLTPLPTHAPCSGNSSVTLGPVPPPPPPPPPVPTVTVVFAVAVRPAPSVTVRFSVCVPAESPVVFHMYVALDPLTLWVESVVVLSCLRTNCVGEPCALEALMLT